MIIGHYLTQSIIAQLIAAGKSCVVCTRVGDRFVVAKICYYHPEFYKSRLGEGQTLMELLHPSAYKIIYEK